ncbi:MAG: S-layer homology domain-containing protein, partial [Clostridiales bacterium]|nr:S-layer homology domain-containing protein [Clostridiales bacterium]
SLVDIDGVKRMAAGDGHAMALKEDGSLWIWGNNTQGQLGDGTSKDRSKPQKVLDNVVDMDGGSSHTLAVQADGSLWAWGYNTYGQVGNNSTINCVTPVRVLDDVKKLACGSYHSLAIKSDNSLWAWGDNIQGQLGDGTKTNRRIPIKIMDDVADVAAGYLHTVVIKTDGSLWTWGYNYSGQLGDGTTVHREAPLKIIESGVASIAASANRTQALMTDGSLWVWGDNGYGQVGDGTTRGRLSPVKVMDGGVAYVTSGGLRTLVLKNDDSLWVCGAGPVGDGKENGAIRSSFIRIMDDVASVATAYHNTFVIKTDGSLWSWGGNHHGVLGYDETIPRKLMPEGSILPYTPKDPSVIESISTITITGLADPVAGGWPFGASDLYTPDNGYAVESVDWNPSVASSFDFGVAYSATITLAADSNYKFVEGVETSVNAGTPSQQGTVIGGDAPGNMFIFRVDFAATEQAKAPEILVPTASPDSGTSFTGELTISLYCATDGASIYYTVDGSDPADITGLLYNEAITLSDTTMLKAVACIDDAYSDIAMFAYTRDAVPDVLHESTPSASVDFTSECLTGLASNAAYSVNGAAKTADLNGNIAIEATWLGTAINIVKIGVASDNTSDSDPQTLALPARPAAPALGKVDTTGGSSNGKITGVDETMEYKAGGASTWTAIAGKELTGLPAGTYSVRFRATPSAFASALASVTIAGSTAPVEGGGGIGVGGGSGGSEVAIVKQEVPLADLLSFPAFIQGFEDNTFRGDSLITREQFVAILFRINNSEATLAADSSAPTFNDVAPSRWSFDAIEWAKEAGIIEADQNGSFRPADPLTRAEMADMFVKAEKLSEAAINAFSDIDGHLHADAILKAAKAGIFTGYTDGTFKPDGNTTRNEAVAALIRYLLGGEPVDAMWQNISVSFSDVLPSHWATKYVRLAVHGYEEMPR